MHLLNTTGMYVKVPTQIQPGTMETFDNENIYDAETVVVMVEIEGIQHFPKVLCPWGALALNSPAARLLGEKEWREFTGNYDMVTRTVSLVAIVSPDVLGAAEFAISMIDLRVDDDESEDRYFVYAVG